MFVIVAACLLLVTATALASADRRPEATGPLAANGEAPVEITVDAAFETVKTGDAVFFDTVVTNPHAEPSAPLILAMNIVNLDAEGDVVDPEDWSPERTQYVDQLAPGESTTLSWRVNAILAGDFMVYMVVLPEPGSAESTTQAVASSGIHLTVGQFTALNPRGVLPLILGAPIVLGVAAGLLIVNRRRETDGSARGSRLLRLPAVGAGVVGALVLLSAAAVASQSPAGESAGETGSAGDPNASGGPTVALDVDTGSDAEDFFFVQTELVAPAGSTITLTLNNLTDADAEIGHNWVLVAPGQEESVLQNGNDAGDDNDWLDVDDPGIIAHTALIEGETSDTITFEAPEPGTYTYLCTFPEHHAGGMVGTLTIEGG
jgi:azurin